MADDTAAISKITAAMFVQLLNTLKDKGVIADSDVRKITTEATLVLQNPDSASVFQGLGEKYEKDLGGH